MAAIRSPWRAGLLAATVFLQTWPVVTWEDDFVCPQRQLGQFLLQTTWPRHPSRAVLADVGANADVHKREGKRVKPAGWFGGFSEHESTYSRDGEGVLEENPERAVMFRPAVESPGVLASGTDNGLPDYWFHESPSGGPNAAWQTHYPPLSGVTGSWFDMNSQLGGRLPWMKTPAGRWQQVYKPPFATFAKTQSMAKDAAWFDTRVEDYDAFGRNREPRQRPARRYLEWKQIGPKTCTLECKKPGCSATCKIDVYKPPVAETKCEMSFGVHPTDFDDEACEETVEWVSINNETVTTHCDPGTRGCMPPAATNTSVIFPCIRTMDVTKELAEGKGSLTVAAKISKLVDECPLANGALLSGVANVTCWTLMPRATTTTSTTTTPPPNPNKCPLQCKPCGCTASCVLTLEPMNKTGHKCLLEVSVRQTDFESPEEVVEWIRVNNNTIKTQCKPGKNQCLQKKAAATSFVHDRFPCISGHDVTSLLVFNDVTSIEVSAKISEMVDECPSNGYYLDGFAEVVCDGNKAPDDPIEAVPQSSLLNATNPQWSSASTDVSPEKSVLASPTTPKPITTKPTTTKPTTTKPVVPTKVEANAGGEPR